MFAALAFLASFLLFTLELYAAKRLLPGFGGAASVWTMSMMVFQGLLLAGYLYGAAAARRPMAHLAVLAGGLLFVPVALPGASVAVSLLAGAGLPFFALASTSVVLQAWRAGRGDAEAYSLYAASNAGSLAALGAYPILLEPALPLAVQGKAWALGYGLFVLLHVPLLQARRRAPEETPAPAPAAAVQARWLLLSLAPSAALLGATNLLTLDLAAVPMVWVLPLALYLLTFVLSFKRQPWFPRRMSLLVLGAAVVWLAALLAVLAISGDLAQPWMVLRRLWVVNKVVFLCAALFTLSLLCHRELALSRPPAGGAGRFYAVLALGGWLGSLLVAVILPFAARRLAMPELDFALAGLIGFGALFMGAAAVTRLQLGALAAVGFAGLAYFVNQSPAFDPGLKEGLRNAYGYCRVTDKDGYRRFYHGNTMHGVQSLDPKRRREALLYFGDGSPVADALVMFGPKASRVGVVGLGVGILAAYGRAGQDWDFYELDPDVIALAKKWFTFLDDTAAFVTLIPGDARLSLEASTRKYGLLILDAFTGGAIPVHTLTREAFALYDRRLEPGGLIVVHVTNRFLNLRPVLAEAARDGGWHAAARQTGPGFGGEKYYSSWVALSRDPAKIESLRKAGWEGLGGESRVRLWTDDYASLLPALRGR